MSLVAPSSSLPHDVHDSVDSEVRVLLLHGVAGVEDDLLARDVGTR
jgi:hypothetical protein